MSNRLYEVINWRSGKIVDKTRTNSAGVHCRIDFLVSNRKAVFIRCLARNFQTIFHGDRGSWSSLSNSVASLTAGKNQISLNSTGTTVRRSLHIACQEIKFFILLSPPNFNVTFSLGHEEHLPPPKIARRLWQHPMETFYRRSIAFRSKRTEWAFVWSEGVCLV